MYQYILSVETMLVCMCRQACRGCARCAGAGGLGLLQGALGQCHSEDHHHPSCHAAHPQPCAQGQAPRLAAQEGQLLVHQSQDHEKDRCGKHCVRSAGTSCAQPAIPAVPICNYSCAPHCRQAVEYLQVPEMLMVLCLCITSTSSLLYMYHNDSAELINCSQSRRRIAL